MVDLGEPLDGVFRMCDIEISLKFFAEIGVTGARCAE
jgi:hypothetical protein